MRGALKERHNQPLAPNVIVDSGIKTDSRNQQQLHPLQLIYSYSPRVPCRPHRLEM